MAAPEISLETARALSLNAQGLLRPPKIPGSALSVVAAIRNLSLLQIDTINVVARAPYFSLFSRLGNYDPSWLEESLINRSIFEYWAHAACFLPVDDYPYHRRMMLEHLRLPGYFRWYERNRQAADGILEHIRRNGEVRSSDFERKDGVKGTWWNWKFEKDALEFWFCAGELMIARREKFQRVYDLRERVLPDWNAGDVPSLAETIRYFVFNSIRALGITRRDWVADYFRLTKKAANEATDALLADGKLVEVAIESWSDAALMVNESLALLKGKHQHLTATHTTLLSPFDSLIFDRKRTKQLFDFDYTIECYLPPAKRKYGYYSLPILHRGRLVARVDAKAHRQKGVFEIKGLFWEPGVLIDNQMLTEVKEAIQRCAEWHKTPEVVISKCVPESISMH